MKRLSIKVLFGTMLIRLVLCCVLIMLAASCDDPDDKNNPAVSITSPEDGSVHRQSDAIEFSGTWSDHQDETLPEDSLVWTSSIDNQIGTGTSFSADNLSAGTHTITFTVTDSDNRSGADSVNVIIHAGREAIPVSSLGADASDPQVAMDDNDNAIITWHQEEENDIPRIYMSEDRNGTGWSTPARINTGDKAARKHAVAMGNNGNGIIVWNQENGDHEDFLGDLIWYTEYRDNGSWVAPTSIMLKSNVEYYTAGSPEVVLNDNGNGIILWYEFSMLEDWAYVCYTEYRNNGAWTAPEFATSYVSDYSSGVGIGNGNNRGGNGLIAWLETTGEIDSAKYIEYSGGGDWSATGTIDGDTDPDNERVVSSVMRVVVNDNGNSIITWSQTGWSDDLERVYIFEYRNGVWSTPSISPIGTKSFKPQVAMNASGNAVIVWIQKVDSINRILMSERRDGDDWSAPNPISTDGINAARPQVAMNDNGDAIIVWMQMVGSSWWQICMSEYRNGAWSRPAVISSLNAVDASSPQVAMNNNGNAIITWKQHGGAGIYRIYMSEINKITDGGLLSGYPGQSTKPTN